jgi:hypothetical protein
MVQVAETGPDKLKVYVAPESAWAGSTARKIMVARRAPHFKTFLIFKYSNTSVPAAGVARLAWTVGQAGSQTGQDATSRKWGC